MQVYIGTQDAGRFFLELSWFCLPFLLSRRMWTNEFFYFYFDQQHFYVHLGTICHLLWPVLSFNFGRVSNWFLLGQMEKVTAIALRSTQIVCVLNTFFIFPKLFMANLWSIIHINSLRIDNNPYNAMWIYLINLNIFNYYKIYHLNLDVH